ncbi:DUF4270 family protein [Botryobacter ruber]|uniref:DUF4270 family protein n=1 Tax=Botryobacter ruber TaxID=2171629 RepID=UPI000E0B68F4|nr:DUF4270 family protein [Botryobacter ruber]
MNLAVRRLFLFFFSITALSACDDPNEIGLELQEGNQIGTEFTDTITINTGTVLLSDSVSSFKLTPSLVGYYADPVLNTQTATTYTEVGAGSSDLTTLANGTTLTLDSLVLTLDYSFIYGEKSAALTVSVHELTEGFSERGSYFTNSTLAYKPNPVGSTTFTPSILKTKVTNVDSAVVARIKLDADFAQTLLEQAGQESLASQQKFNNFLKGIALVPSTDNPASIVGFNMNSTATAMRLYYKAGTEATQKVHVFNFSGSDVRNFYSVTADRAGTTLATLEGNGSFVPASETGNESFVQANTQLLTKITFPHLDEFREKKGNIIINRAELILPVTPSSNSTLPSHPAFVLYEATNSNRIKRNAAGLPLAVQQEGTYNLNSTLYPATVAYNASKNHYRLNMTSFVQGIIYGNKENTGLLLSSGNASVVSGSQVSERQVTPEPRPYRTIISNTAAEPVKLLIYYSKLN